MEKIECSSCRKAKDISEMQTDKTCIKCIQRQKEIRSLPKYQLRKKKYYEDNKEDYAIYGHEYRRSPLGRFKKAKKAVVKRGLEFSISYEDYVNKISKPCYYCEDFFPRVEAGVGLDRLNNDLGYTDNNVVSCCDICNTLKNSTFSPEETRAAVSAIIKIRKSNNV